MRHKQACDVLTDGPVPLRDNTGVRVPSELAAAAPPPDEAVLTFRTLGAPVDDPFMMQSSVGL